MQFSKTETTPFRFFDQREHAPNSGGDFLNPLLRAMVQVLTLPILERATSYFGFIEYLGGYSIYHSDRKTVDNAVHSLLPAHSSAFSS